jgi:cation diffusion facilitator CzcD-associated flavoprotein CzcO
MRFEPGPRCFAVLGAGPYGLAVASHLRAAGVEVRVFGKAMDFWQNQMPKGMLVRSPYDGTHIADPERALTLKQYEDWKGAKLPKQIPLEDFVRYGQWFQNEALPDLDPRLVTAIERADDGFDLTLEDGEALSVDGVVVAAGIGSFPNFPAPLASLSSELVTHSSARVNSDLGRFEGRQVIVLGGGQTAIESAALLREAGAEVEVVMRQPSLRFLKPRRVLSRLMDSPLNPFKAPGTIGPMGINWLVEHPFLFTLFPRRMQDAMARRAIRPAASSWLRPRVEGVPILTGREVVAAEARADRVRVRLQDGTAREADHVLLATGYRIDIDRYPFLSPDLLRGIRTANGYPVLNRGFESSVPGLHFVGATAAHSFGPLCRFVAGTRFTAATLAGFVVRNVRRPKVGLLVHRPEVGEEKPALAHRAA